MLLVVGLLARGHLFQSLGFAFGCEHPGEDASSQLNDHGSNDDEGCPPNCHHCPCGQIPMVPPSVEPLARLLLDLRELDDVTPPEEPGQLVLHRLDRPPRRPRA